MPQDVNIVIGGEAGQGLVTIGQLLSKVLVRAGYEILVTQGYQSRIRGGHNTFAVRVSTERRLAPRGSIDILVALNRETIDLHREQLTEKGRIITDSGFASDAADTIGAPFTDLGPERLWNTVAFGLLGNILGLPPDMLFQAVEGMIGKKHPETLPENKEILDKSYQWATAHVPQDLFTMSGGQDQGDRLMLNGNDAIALGALAGGVRFCSFYPMTPSTSIALNLITHADVMGVVVEQTEDEIAAVNMAIGASFAGAPSMVVTSGGGFALMVEGISLAGMTETPLLVVVGQRPGPATGLPTRTEQGDLEFVLHAGHGEFPRAVYAPATLESCYRLTQTALQTSERYQTPVFLLTDQFLADSYRAIPPFDVEKISPVRTGTDQHLGPQRYKRYTVTESGISPRLLPGVPDHLVVADSDEHYEDGHITEDLEVRVAMVDKRLRKLQGLQGEVLPPGYDGEGSVDLLLVCWGSTLGPVKEAVAVLRQQGRNSACLHFEQVWPLIPAQFLDFLASAKKVVCVEGNATAQFAGLIRRETGFAVSAHVLRYDGLPFTARYILDRLPI